jgi:hypothetical protein
MEVASAARERSWEDDVPGGMERGMRGADGEDVRER